MAKIILGKWIGYKYVFIERCPITELQDYIVLKLIQEQGCRLNSPKKPSINLVNGNETDQQRENVYSEFNGKEIDVSDKKNWYLRNNVLFLKLGTTQFGKDILLISFSHFTKHFTQISSTANKDRVVCYLFRLLSLSWLFQFLLLLHIYYLQILVLL